MKPGGIHLLLTYKCNASCEHCFLSCGPRRAGVFSPEQVRKYIQDATKTSYINHFFIEGGEPFLYPGLLRQTVADITAAGYWVGVLTNGFWAGSEEKARETLEPLVAAGIGSLGISTDAWHHRFVPVETAQRAQGIAREMGIEADLMVCAGEPDAGVQGDDVLSRLAAGDNSLTPGRVVCRGRAATTQQCRGGSQHWEDLTTCSIDFGGRDRVHLGPFGDIHLCQGLLLGRDARRAPLSRIFREFRVHDHPICAALSSGGPAALARLAMRSGFVPAAGYQDGCHLCFESRRHLLPLFPELIGPAAIYEPGTGVESAVATG